MNISYQGNLVRITSFWKTKTRGLITHSNRGNDNSCGVYLEIGIPFLKETKLFASIIIIRKNPCIGFTC